VNRTSFRKALAPSIAVLALSISLTACGAGNESAADTGEGSGETSGLSGDLNGGGASSQEKAQAAWRAGFQETNPDVTVNYDPIGSGDGRANFISEAFAFAGTDSALDDDEGELSDAQARCADGNVIQVPAYVSPIAVVYNLPGVDELNLSPETIAEIFNGTITEWDDPAIAETNPDAELPSTSITPVHRQDDSGTTENFTAYLSEAGGGAWTEEPDGLWPDSLGGEAAEGTSGLVGAVGGGEGTIGYADFSAVGDLGVVNVGVGEEFTAPSAEGAALVVANSPAVEGAPETDMAVELDRTTTESGAYPVLLVSYMIACETYADEAEAELVREYLTYVVSDEGQQAAADEAGSAPLDPALSEKATGLLENISAG
jgi:phosphate transport system substrate-binding protein